jgi:acyl carrier protein
VPIGVSGELYIGGDGVARGYLNRPELTAEKFVVNPFSIAEQELVAPMQHDRGHEGDRKGEGCPRLYRTGDIARYRADGTIECLGRNDFQIKLRGHRIDLGEIESALRQHPEVRDAVVSLHGDNTGQKYLAGYLQKAGGSSLQAASFQQFLRSKLPDYMVPAVFIALDKFPLTPNGKINRKALPASTSAQNSKRAFTPPHTITEETLAQMWRELLQLPRVGVDDNFFEIGGHSLLAMQFMARVQNTFRTELSLRDIFEAPTIAELAALVERRRRKPAKESFPPLPRPRKISSERAKELLGRLDELSETEVESLLQQVSAGSGK